MKLCIAVVFLTTVAVSIAHSRLLTGRSRTIGGRSIEKTHIPYQVSLRYHMLNTHICSGVIVAPDWILTSARCVHSFDGSDLRAVYGARRLSGPYQMVEIDRVIVHPSYNTTNNENDIAMLLTTSKIEYDTNIVNEIPLATEPSVAGSSVTVSGWGLRKIYFGTAVEYHPDELQCQKTAIMSNEECKVETGRLSGFLHGEKTICTRNHEDHGIYKGDIGSPLVSDAGLLVGIASWFTGLDGKPDVYTAIASYESWIQSFIQQHEALFGKPYFNEI